MKTEERAKKIEEIENQLTVDSIQSNLHRARSLMVGSAFNGVIEVGMRDSNGTYVWCLMDQLETVEIINLLAAIIGCTVDIQRRDDFASWRKWPHKE